MKITFERIVTSRRLKSFWWLSLAVVAGLAMAQSRGLRADDNPSDSKTMVEPKYNAAKELIRPEGYRSWIFVGASIGLSYSDRAREEGPGNFHHIYMQPQAFEQYKATGKFPEKTMLVMEVHAPEQKVSINRQGYFEGERKALEVAVKDRATIPEGWAYFDFANGTKATSSAFPKQSCYDCHLEHGATDNVFTQFYPVLRELKKN